MSPMRKNEVACLCSTTWDALPCMQGFEDLIMQDAKSQSGFCLEVDTAGQYYAIIWRGSYAVFVECKGSLRFAHTCLGSVISRSIYLQDYEYQYTAQSGAKPTKPIPASRMKRMIPRTKDSCGFLTSGLSGWKFYGLFPFKDATSKDWFDAF